MTDRCDMTDLLADACAHCRGDAGADLPAGDPRRFQATATGILRWPPAHATRTPREPGPREPEATDDPRIRVARDLRSIADMIPLLDDRGEDLADSPDMPGGDATAALAIVASPATWERRVDLAESAWLADPDRHRKPRPDPSADESEWEPPLQTLLFWSEDWRHQLGMMHEAWLPTIATEANFLAAGDVLDWAWSHEPRIGDFVTDIAAARVRMENVVRAGIRTTRSRILCDRPHEQTHKRLTLIYGPTSEAAGYLAPCCHARYTADEAKRAHAKQMRSAGAERWITTVEATGALAVQGWQRRTVRRWIEPLRVTADRCMTCRQTWTPGKYDACPGIVRGLLCAGVLESVWRGDRDAVPASYCETATRRVLVWWPDLWRRHLVARQERETAI